MVPISLPPRGDLCRITGKMLAFLSIRLAGLVKTPYAVMTFSSVLEEDSSPTGQERKQRKI